MVTEYEAEKLRRDMQSELDDVSMTTVVKCTVGIVVLVVLALVSPTLGLERDGTPHASPQTAAR